MLTQDKNYIWNLFGWKTREGFYLSLFSLNILFEWVLLWDKEAQFFVDRGWGPLMSILSHWECQWVWTFHNNDSSDFFLGGIFPIFGSFEDVRSQNPFQNGQPALNIIKWRKKKGNAIFGLNPYDDVETYIYTKLNLIYKHQNCDSVIQ